MIKHALTNANSSVHSRPGHLNNKKILPPLQSYRATGACERLSSTAIVANRRVKYTIWDTTGKTAFKIHWHYGIVRYLCRVGLIWL